MYHTGSRLAAWLVATGSGLLGLGLLLLLVKLAMVLAWYAGGWIALAGAVMLAAGFLMRGGTGRT
jgi:hypothetical protein